MSVIAYLFKYLFPGIFLIGLAFWAGTHPSMVISLAGFLAFFTAGVTLIIEGTKQAKKEKADGDGFQKKEEG